MGVQNNSTGTVRNTPPRCHLVPMELEELATQLRRSTCLPNAQSISVFNPSNHTLVIVTEPHLDA